VFLGCNPGFQDFDGDCTSVGGTCATGCEACKALGDGSFDVPDDGMDNDCAGGDSTNTDLLGWYVDPAFTPTGTGLCAGNVARGTRGCPFTTLVDATFAASQQSWTSPGPTRRYVYLAEGSYLSAGTVFDTTVPLVFAGGYKRTVSGPWTRNGAATSIASTTAGASVVVGRLAALGAWSVVDGVTMGQTLQVSGNFVVRKVAAPTGLSGPAIALGAGAAVTGRVETSAVAQVGDQAMSVSNTNWSLVDSTVQGDVSFSDGWTFEGVRVTGTLYPRASSKIVVRDVTVTGSIWVGGAYGTMSDSSFGTSVVYFNGPTNFGASIERSSFAKGLTFGNGTLRNSVVGPNVQLAGCGTVEGNVFADGPDINVSQTVGFRRNTVNARLVVSHNFAGAMLLEDNLLLGGLTLLQQSATTRATVAANFLRGRAGATEALLIQGGGGQGAIVANNLIHVGDLANTASAIRESSATSDPVAVLNNAFIGFTPTSLYLDENATPLADLASLNTHNQWSVCARGGNVSFATNAAAGLRSSVPGDPLIGKLSGGPLLDAAKGAPFTCDTWTLNASASDVTGANARVCRAGQDIGAYELCP
jgi:hypothetical protein